MNAKALIAAVIVVIVVVAAAVVVWNNNGNDNSPNDDTPADVPGGDTPEDIPDDTPEETPDEDTPGTDTPGTDVPDTDVPGSDTPGEDTPDEPIGPDTEVVFRTDLQEGDYITMNYHEYAILNGETIEYTDVQTQTITAIDGDTYTVSLEVNGEPSGETTYEGDTFLNELIPYEDELPETPDRQETLTTTWGNIVCDVYTMDNPHFNIDGDVITSYWVDASTGAIMKMLTTVDDGTTSAGAHVEHYEIGFELVDTNLIS